MLKQPSHTSHTSLARLTPRARPAILFPPRPGLATLATSATFATLATLAALATLAPAPRALAQQNSTVPIEYLRPMKNSVSIGVRLIGGASVDFGGAGLGAISGLNPNDINPATNNTYRKDYVQQLGYFKYDNGTVYYTTDSSGASSTGSRPDQTGIPAGADGRWQTVVTLTSTIAGVAPVTVVNGNYLAYDTSGNSTRIWNATSTAQTGTNADGSNYVDMSNYASNGVQGQAHAKSNASPGIELQFSHIFQRFKRFEWGLNVTFGISEFNAKNRQNLKANAVQYTDRYQVLAYAQNPTDPTLGFVTVTGTLATGTDGTPIISGPSFDNLPYTDADGNTVDASGNPLVFTNGLETTAPLGIGGDYLPTSYTASSVDNAYIQGYWQVKGVYYLARVGPMIRVPIGRQFSASLSAGYIAAWVGSKMRFSETLVIPGIASKPFTLYDSTGAAITDFTKLNQKYLSGAYADLNFEWWLSTRTGFYVGAVYEKLSNYKQQAYGRVAAIKMDNGPGLHFGVITRF